MAAVLESLPIARPSSIRSSVAAHAACFVSARVRKTGLLLPDYKGLRIETSTPRITLALTRRRTGRTQRGGIVCEAQETAVDVPAVTDTTWKSLVLEGDLPVLVEFWAPWCGPCRMIHPIIDELARHSEISRVSGERLRIGGFEKMLLIRSLRSRPRFPSILHSPFSTSAAAVQAEKTIREGPRNDWSRDEIKSVYDSPVLDLLFHGAQVHRHAHNFREVQQCTLLSIKTGGCSEDCSYCPQSSRYNTGLKAQKLMNKDAVLEAARKAKEAGSTRFCMGAAWRDTVGRKTNFNQILEYVKEIRSMGMEVCCTLGMLEKQQAVELKKAGLTAYNHNLDTSREYYPNIITTRSYDERLETLQFVREAGINVCSGGIIGLGEAEEDRVGLLHTLATLPTHPESVPINALVPVKGTPLQDQKPVEIWEMIRMIATARIVMPNAMVRLSAGRVRFSIPEQALCFLAGANSIFTGEKLLTTPNNDFDADQLMFRMLGLTPKAPDFPDEAADLETERCEAVSNAG